MGPITITPVQIGDRVRLRKPHACGSFDWTIFRVGADVGLKCDACGRRIMLARRDFERRLDHIITTDPPGALPKSP